MTEPTSVHSPERLNTSLFVAEDDMNWHEPPSSPFVAHLDNDQENIAPDAVASTPVKSLIDFDIDFPQSAFKVPSTNNTVLKGRDSPLKMSFTKSILADNTEDSFHSPDNETPTKKSSPIKQINSERSESAMSGHSRKEGSPSKSSRMSSIDSTDRNTSYTQSSNPDTLPSPAKRSSSASVEHHLRDNEGLTMAVKVMEETRTETIETFTTRSSHTDFVDLEDTGIEDTEFNPDGPDFTSVDIDDTCYSTFSELPNLDMTKFAVLRKSPAKNGLFDQTTPRARTQMTPSTVRRTERTPSPTPRRTRKDNDTTNLLLDFTAQIEAFGESRRSSPNRGRKSPSKSSTEPNLLSYIQNQRSPAKGGSHVPATPSQSRHLLNLLDFELPPPPTPRSVPTVTIRELESLKSSFQSQISSLTASLSGKEAQVESLVQAISDAERRVGEAQESLRDERSSREHAEAQMVDWKNKGEEVQKLLQDVQAELARNDTERDILLSRLMEAEKRAEEAESRSSELETRAIEAESKNVDMTTFINPDDDENKKIYSEMDCQAAIAEKVNDVARDLHTAYKAKHEKKIKALKDNYQKKADDRCKELRLQIIRLERQVEEAEKKRDDTFSKVLPDSIKDTNASIDAPVSVVSNGEDLKKIEAQKAEIENLKAKLAGLHSELESLKKSQEVLIQDLEAERVEKGELVAAAEQMLSMCGEKMEELQQEEMKKSQLGGRPPAVTAHSAPAADSGSLRSTGFLAGGPAPVSTSNASRPGSALSGRPGSAIGDRLGAMAGVEKTTNSGIAKPSGLRAPGGFSSGLKAPGLNRSTSGAGNKSRLMSNIERMGGRNGE
ncbi:hypothetical protein B0J11DRAFT_31644 [Dendryphion nanum]|uniref:Uncharacterized protein n=1 Tax=Dendryphion nanum TaxID=256645 RepID=A0A9P9IYX4_9PLEO|nr:hypothetical protein B0J11DRAFT_31644 [Dendryphion nanum]